MSASPHTHTPACRAGNELGELTCIELDGEHLAAARRFEIQTHDAGRIAVFSFSADDALDLASAAGHIPIPATLQAGPEHCFFCERPALAWKGVWQCNTRRCSAYGETIREIRPDEAHHMRKDQRA